MKTKTYTPQPIDTTGVELPKELEQLVEKMSKNVHEVWAETRPEEEKEYDRNTSIGTLKLIMKLGFKISQ